MYLNKKRSVKEQLAQEASWLFSDIYRNNGDGASDSDHSGQGEIGRNKPFNGHLTGYINECRRSLEQEIEQAQQYKAIAPADFAAVRTKGTKMLFDLLMHKDMTNHR